MSVTSQGDEVPRLSESFITLTMPVKDKYVKKLGVVPLRLPAATKTKLHGTPRVPSLVPLP